jgi:cold-inducible RNA-binding protein
MPEGMPNEGGERDIDHNTGKVQEKRGQTMKIYVGNLSFNITEDEILAEFGTYGKVESVVIPSDKISGQPKGYAFVEMASKAEAEAAIAGLNGKTVKERPLVISESRPREDRGGSSYGNKRRVGYGSGGNYGGGKQRKY